MRGQGQGGNTSDQTTNFFWLMILIILIFLGIWVFARHVIVSPIFWIRGKELALIHALATGWGDVAHYVHLPSFSETTLKTLKNMELYIQKVPARDVQFFDFKAINIYVGEWMRFPAALILLGLAVYLYFIKGGDRFRHAYKMEALKKAESENWPQINPVISLDLVKQDLNKGEWAMAQVPLDFGKKHNLLTTELNEKNGNYEWALLRGPAYRVMTMQMGPLWQGIDALPIHIKALFVIFMARALRERDVSRRLIRQIALSATSGKLDFSGVNATIKRYAGVRPLQWLELRHAYVYTLMGRLLEMARTDGVVATAEFLWLKPLDRRLWFMLNTIGRQTAVVEVAGPYAHYLAERKIGRALKIPMVKEAVNALELAVKDILYVPETSTWRIPQEA